MPFCFQGPQLGLRLTWTGASTPGSRYKCLCTHLVSDVQVHWCITYRCAQKFQDICKNSGHGVNFRTTPDLRLRVKDLLLVLFHCHNFFSEDYSRFGPIRQIWTRTTEDLFVVNTGLNTILKRAWDWQSWCETVEMVMLRHGSCHWWWQWWGLVLPGRSFGNFRSRIFFHRPECRMPFLSPNQQPQSTEG